MITTTEYGQNLVKYIYFNSYVVIKILLRYDYFKKIPHPLFRYLGNFDRICIFLQERNCFGLVRVTSSWLRMGSVAVDSFEWVVEDDLGGPRWLWEVLVGLIF